MKILLNLNQPSSCKGVQLKIPSVIQKKLASWSKAGFMQYPFGTLLTQSYHQQHYAVNIYELVLEHPADLYIEQSPMLALQYVFSGNISGPTSALPETGHCRLINMDHFPEAIHCGAGKLFWLQIEWDPSYSLKLGEGGVESGQLVESLADRQKEIPISSLANHIVGELRDCKETGMLLHWSMQIYHTQLLLHHIHSLNENVTYQKLRSSLNTETLLTIYQLIKATPHIHLYSVGYLTRKFRISARCLKQGFTSMFSMSFSDYVQQICMQQANYLLKNTEYTVDEIADQLGYAARSNFSRSYKRYHGISPRAYRDQDRAQVIQF